MNEMYTVDMNFKVLNPQIKELLLVQQIGDFMLWTKEQTVAGKDMYSPQMEFPSQRSVSLS